MDYCSSCRRHLNGALVCPGCGAYAPDIAPTTADGRIVPATGTTTGPATGTATGTGTDPAATVTAFGAGFEDGPYGDSSVEVVDVVDVAGAPTAPDGRAARRRQRARWKKNQRRAVVATAVALVGGGLAMSATDRQGGDRAMAATAPEDPGPGAVEDPASQDVRPTVRPEPAHSSAPPKTASPGAEPAADLSHRQSTAASHHAAAPATRSYAVTSQHRTVAPATRTTNTSPASSGTAGSPGTTGTTGTAGTSRPATPQDTAPAPAPAPAPGSSRTDTTPTSTTTAPSELCLLVVCLPLS
ncbi:hypothetical protein ACIGO8_09770 [Streptomyces sp. NPDC053493]|uniref:SCO2400 family protein n=1 Tax=Streptomyces sp. NPDC053493 TaxID=3365705 RepID=UPI0037CE3925